MTPYEAPVRRAKRRSATGTSFHVRGPLWELAAVLCLIAVYEFAEDVFSGGAVEAMNLLGPAWLGIVVVFAAWTMLRGNPDHVWTAMFWFRIGVAVYFCAGSVLPVLASYTIVNNLRSMFAFQAADIFKLNMITAYAALTVLATSRLVDFAARGRSASSGGNRREISSEESDTLWFANLFLIAGAVLKVFFIIPAALGVSSFVLPGALVAFGNATYIAIYLYTIMSLNRSPWAFAVVCALVVAEVATGLLLFNKSMVLLPFIFFSLGWLHARVTAPKVIAVVAVFMLSFAVLQPWVAHARTMQVINYGVETSISAAERWSLLDSFFSTSTQTLAADSLEQSFTRFTFVNAATFVISRYDMGSPGDVLRDALPLLVPRILWPDKPTFSPGAELAFLATGEIGNSISAGLFPEAYWWSGWWGIPTLMIPYGIILALASRYTLSILRRGDWIYLPAVMLALTLGIKVDNSYTTTVIGGTALLLGVHFVCYFMGMAIKIFAPSQRRRNFA